MATRLNTKFILILLAFVGCAVILVGGLAVYKWKNDPIRYLRKGDAFAEVGDWDQAFKNYGRAYGKNKGNLEYLDLTLDALKQIIPESHSEAVEKYKIYAGNMQLRTRIAPLDPEPWEDLLTLSLQQAIVSKSNVGWQRLSEQAGDMAETFGEDDPNWVYAVTMKCYAQTHRSSILTNEEFDEIIEELEFAIERSDENTPESVLDLTWSSLITTLVNRASIAQLTAENSMALEYTAEADRYLLDAAESGITGPYMERAKLRRLLIDDDSTNEERSEATTRIIASIETVDYINDYEVLEIALEIISGDEDQGILKASALLESHIDDHPNAIIHKRALGVIQQINDPERGLQTVQEIIDMKMPPVSLEGASFHDLQVLCAVQIFDNIFRRWQLAELDDRGQYIDSLSKNLEVVQSLTAGEVDDSMLLKCRAKVFVAERSYREAAALFQELLNRGINSDVEIYTLSALCALELDEFGFALNRINDALVLSPRSLSLMQIRARALMRVGRFDEAKLVLNELIVLQPDNMQAQELLISLRDRIALVGSPDELSARLGIGFRKAKEDDYAGAYADIQQIQEEYPDDIRPGLALVQISVAQGDQEKTTKLYKTLAEKFPDSSIVKQFGIIIEHESPIDRALALVDQNIENNEEPREVRAFIAVDTISRLLGNEAESLSRSNPVRSRELQAYSDSGKEVADELLQEVEQGGYQSRELTRALLSRALLKADYDAAAKVISNSSSEEKSAEQMMLLARFRIAQQDFIAALEAMKEARKINDSSSEVHGLLGTIYNALGNSDLALKSFQEAYERRPNDLSTVRRYGEALISVGRTSEAVQVCRQLHSMLPNSTEVQEIWIRMESEYGNPLKALMARGSIFNVDPDDRENALALQKMLYDLPVTRTDILNEDGSEMISKSQWSSLPFEEQNNYIVTLREQRTRSAESIHKTLMEKDPLDFQAMYVRATGIRTDGDFEAGRVLLQNFISDSGDDANSMMWITLGRYLSDSSLERQAKEAFNKAIELQDPQVRDADLVIAELYAATSQWESAKPHIESLLEVKSDRHTLLRMVEAYEKTGEFKKASELLNETNAEESYDDDFIVQMLWASIERGLAEQAWASGNMEEGEKYYAMLLERVERARQLNTTSPLPIMQEFTAHQAHFQVAKDQMYLDRALDAAERAVTVKSDYWPASKALATTMVQQGRLGEAKNEVKRNLAISPRNNDARRMLIDMHVRTDDIPSAIAIANEAARSEPKNPIWHMARGELLLKANRIDDAITSLTAGYNLQPSIGVLHRIVDISFRNNPPGYEEVIELLRTRKSEVDSSVYLRSAIAACLMRTGQPRIALQMFREAFLYGHQQVASKEAPASLMFSWYENLIRAYPKASAGEMDSFVRQVSGGRLDAIDSFWLGEIWGRSGPDGYQKALEYYNLAVEQDDHSDPRLSARFFVRRGTLSYLLGDCDSGIMDLGESLDYAPGIAPVMNNLAYMLAKCRGEYEEGLSMSTRALTVSPNNPQYLDTHGFILTGLNRLDEAERYLLKANSIAPDAAINFHIASVLAKKGDNAGARTFLVRAGDYEPDEDLQSQINELMESLN